MRFHNVPPISRAEAERAFTNGDSEEMCEALVRLAYHAQDCRYVQDGSIPIAASNILNTASASTSMLVTIYLWADDSSIT